MASGISLDMQAITRPEPTVLHVSAYYGPKGTRRKGDGITYAGGRDRSLRGKARRKARRSA